jgi:hypothetical protein
MTDPLRSQEEPARVLERIVDGQADLNKKTVGQVDGQPGDSTRATRRKAARNAQKNWKEEQATAQETAPPDGKKGSSKGKGSKGKHLKGKDQKGKDRKGKDKQGKNKKGHASPVRLLPAQMVDKARVWSGAKARSNQGQRKGWGKPPWAP